MAFMLSLLLCWLVQRATAEVVPLFPSSRMQGHAVAEPRESVITCSNACQCDEW